MSPVEIIAAVLLLIGFAAVGVEAWRNYRGARPAGKRFSLHPVRKGDS